MATTLASQVQELYVGYLGRAADKAGLDFWVKAIESGTSTLESVALGFTLSEEYKAQYNGLTTTQLVAKVYQNVLGRAADADGLAFWAGEVNKGVIKAETLVKTMIGSLGAIDQLTIDNKVAAANTYTEAAGANYSVEAGKAAVAGAGVGSVPGVVNPSQTFTLTAGNDYADAQGFFLNGGNFSNAGFKFSAANERINATSTTLTAGDILIDGSTADADVLALALSGAAPAVGAATIQNIESMAITATNTGAASIDFANVTGMKSVTVTGAPTAAVTLNNVNSTGITSVDASGVTSAAGNVTVTFAASTSTAALTLTGGAGADSLTGGLGADTIVGGAGNNFLSGGAGNDTITGGAGVDRIDGGSGNDTIVGGAGADLIVTGAGNDKVTGGGGNDIIALGTVAGGITAVSAVAAATVAGAVAAGTNTVVFEATAGANGNDSITGFNTGALAAGGDVLDFSAFLGAAASLVVVNAGDTNADNLQGFNVVVNTANALGAAVRTDALTWSASTNYVLIETNGTDSTVSYVTTDGAGAIASETVVATLVGVNTLTGAADVNFI